MFQTRQDGDTDSTDQNGFQVGRVQCYLNRTCKESVQIRSLRVSILPKYANRYT